MNIVASLFRTMAAMGSTIHHADLATISASYLRNAQDAIAQYAADAEMNLLRLDRHAEELLAEAFARQVIAAGERTHENPTWANEIPNWARVLSAFPDAAARLRAAVDADVAQHRRAA